MSLILKLILEEWQAIQVTEWCVSQRGNDAAVAYIIEAVEHLAWLYQHIGIDTPEEYILHELDMNKDMMADAHENVWETDLHTRTLEFWQDKATEFGLSLESLGVDDWPKNNSPDGGGQP